MATTSVVTNKQGVMVLKRGRQIIRKAHFHRL